VSPTRQPCTCCGVGPEKLNTCVCFTTADEQALLALVQVLSFRCSPYSWHIGSAHPEHQW